LTNVCKASFSFRPIAEGKLEVIPMEEFREKQSAGADYIQGTPDGSRPGHVNVNTSNFEKRKDASHRNHCLS